MTLTMILLKKNKRKEEESTKNIMKRVYINIQGKDLQQLIYTNKVSNIVVKQAHKKIVQ